MKSTLLAIVLLFAPALALAADAVVVINSLTNVTVNGVASGTVVDVLANSTAQNIRARMLDALIAYDAVRQAARDAAVATAESSQAAAVAKTAAIVVALKKVDPEILPDVVKTELLSATEKERAALLAAKADADAKLAALP